MKMLAYGCAARSITDLSVSDSLTVKVAESEGERVAFAVIARIRGERKQADIAGATVVKMLSDWFAGLLSAYELSEADESLMQAKMNQILDVANAKIRHYCRQKCLQLSAEITAVIIADEKYYYISTGSEKAYCLGTGKYEELSDPCGDGAAPVWNSGSAGGNSSFLICTKEIGESMRPEDLTALFKPEKLPDILSIKMRLNHLTELKTLGQGLGNSSAILIRLMEAG